MKPDPGSQLDSFDLGRRLEALERLAGASARRKPVPAPHAAGTDPGDGLLNMHLHSFFSYNADGYSPCRIAWEARRAGLYAAALCDFDVLDGLEEFIKAGLILGLRTAVHLETRAFLKDYAGAEINSPGEPGVVYIMGSGFPRAPETDTREAATLSGLRRLANDRNSALVRRINRRLPEIEIDFENEVVPLSPGGCPTERHIVRAYRLKAEAAFGSPPAARAFWARLMKKEPAEIGRALGDVAALEDSIRSLLVKAGGLGYEQPTERSFPSVDGFIGWVLACGAIPTITWLDGMSSGEENTPGLIEHMKNRGACALNIIPDRNHNIGDPALRALKLRKLDEVIQTAQSHELPINIGTEMNKAGQPFADDLGCAALKPYRQAFLNGARIMVGQTLLSRFADYSYAGEAALAEYGGDTGEKNGFFQSVGGLPPLTLSVAGQLEGMGPEKALSAIRDSTMRGSWIPRLGGESSEVK